MIEAPGIWLEALKVVASFAVVGVAIAGLYTWQRQLHGTAEYDLARRLLRRVYEVRDRIALVRHPFISPGEFASAFEDAGLKPEQGPGLDPRSNRLVYSRRWKTLVSANSDFGVELLEAEVLWGNSIQKAGRQLQQLIGELSWAVSSHLDQRDNPEESRGMRELRIKWSEIVYDKSSPDTPDEFSVKVLSAVSELEAIARPHLDVRFRRVVS